MAGQRALLLAGFLLSGFLLPEAAEILTVSSLGECWQENQTGTHPRCSGKQPCFIGHSL